MKPKKIIAFLLLVIFSLSFVYPFRVNAAVYPQDNLIINISNIPQGINKIVALLENNSTSTRLEVPYDSSGNVNESFTVPSGERYTIKVIGYKESGTFPSVLAEGKATNVNIGETVAIEVNLTLSEPKIEVDLPTPTQVKTSELFTVKLRITDPGDFLEGNSSGRLWWNTSIPSINLTGAQPSGTLTKISDGQYEFQTQLTSPSAPGKIYYQFGENNYRFNSPLGNEAPFFALPNYSIGQQPFCINVVDSTPNMSLNIDNIPPGVTKMVAVLENGGTPIRLVIPHTEGVSEAANFYVPAADGYKIKIIGYKESGTFPSVLAEGKATDVNLSETETTGVNITLSEPKIEVDSSTPIRVKTSEQFTVKLRITDPGDFLEGNSSGRLWWNTSIPSINLTGAQPSGTLTKISDGQYEFQTQLTAPSAPGKIYYQFGENNYRFNSPLGNEAPFLALPNYSIGQQPLSVNVVENMNNLSLNLDNIPSGVTKMVAVLENGGTPIRLVIPHAEGVSEAANFYVPPAEGYKIKIIGYKESGTFPSVLAEGKATNVNLSETETTGVNITLSEPKIEVDSSTPIRVKTSEQFTVKLRITDPGDFLEGKSSGRLWWNTTIPSINLNGSQPSGTLTKISDGQYEFQTQLTAPSAPGKIYYQFGESNYSFDSPLGDEAPFLALPNYSIEQQPFIISAFRNKDINNDGAIDIKDLAIVSQSYNSKLTSNGWDENKDINGDNLIDIYDLVLVSNDIH